MESFHVKYFERALVQNCTTLKNMALDMDKKDDSLLQNLGQKGKERKEEINDGEIKQLHMKHGVKK